MHQQFNTSSQYRDSDIVYVRNDTGCDLQKFDSVGLDYVVGYDEIPTYGASRPNSCRHTGRFAVLISGLLDGQIGQAVISGVTPMYAPQLGSVGIARTNASLSTSTLPPMTVDAGFFGPQPRVQRAIGLHKVHHDGSAAVIHYDDIGSEYQDLAVVKMRNPGAELLEANRSRCQCADGSCTYRCSESDGEYSWSLFRQDCDRADIAFSKQGWHAAPTDDDTYQHTACECEASPLTSRECSQATLGSYLTAPCIAPNNTISTVQFSDTDEFCGQYCLWHGETLIRGCDESCNSDCSCVSPVDLGPLITGTIYIGDKIPQLVRTPCLRIDEGGVCIHMAGSNGWTEVYNNCSSVCPCDDPPDDASSYPSGYRYSQKCNKSRCIPCSPSGHCKWRYNEVSATSGFFTKIYAQWTLIDSSCPPGCECPDAPPGYSGDNQISAFTGNRRYAENEVLTVPCCKSPYRNSPCDPTTTSTTSTAPPPTTPLPPGACGCNTARQYCEWTCKNGNVGQGIGWYNTHSVCCNRYPPLSCSCGRGFVAPYPCTAAVIGHKSYSNCTPANSLPSAASVAVSDPSLLPTISPTTTTTTTTTSHPTVDPSTTPAISASYFIANNGTTEQPTCRVLCIKSSPSLDESGNVHQSGYTTIETGTIDGLCSRYGENHACILFSPCNESTAGQVLEGICKRVDRDA